jgi:hypothetical protein
MGESVLVPIAFFAMIAAIVIAPKYYRSRDRERLLDTLRVAYDRGQPVPPELIDNLTKGENLKAQTPDRDLRTGIMLMAVAVAFVVLAWSINYVEGDEEAWIIAAVGAFPGFIGLGHLAFWAARRGRADRTAG